MADIMNKTPVYILSWKLFPLKIDLRDQMIHNVFFLFSNNVFDDVVMIVQVHI